MTDAIFICQGEVGDWSEATSVIGADGRLGSIKEFKPHTKMIFAAEKVNLFPFDEKSLTLKCLQLKSLARLLLLCQ